MSDVRLSNASPTLERTDPRVAEHPKPSACRNLFGTSVDHEELHRDLKVHLRELEADASDKWSFDFANDAPILANTRITWELVDCRTVPDFYTRQPHPVLLGVRPRTRTAQGRGKDTRAMNIRPKARGHTAAARATLQSALPERAAPHGRRKTGRREEDHSTTNISSPEDGGRC
uniref:Cyclin-dependent kinase inhibitor 1B n=1 Tax=Knipowitschia caucasica TaxID=637954 RepID=A0AAV2KQG9_KNICA